MRILMYHNVVEGVPPDIHSVSVTQFAAQMAWLHRNEYQVLTVEAWFAAQRAGQSVPSKSVAITFDDGFADNYKLAWPILHQHNFSATIFLVTGAINATSRWREGELAHTRLLSFQQILEMADQGIEFGSHTVTHPRLTQLANESEMDCQLVDSKIALEQLLKREVTSFCYPYSQFNKVVKQRVQQAGYQLALTYKPGYVGSPGQNYLELNRVGILTSDTLETFVQKVQATITLRIKWYRQEAKRMARCWLERFSVDG